MIAIIGGGPIGCYSAALLAKNNEVNLYEENKETGLPIQCTGILSDTINELIPLKKSFVANKIFSARIFSPNNKHIKINFKKPNIIVHRNRFDQHFRDLALKNCAKMFYNHRFTNKKTVMDLNRKKQKNIKYDYIIGADGPLSKVSQIYRLGRRKHLRGVQALIKKENDNTVDFYPHVGTYAWAVPQSDNILRVGVAAEKNTLNIFNDFSKRYKGRIIGWQGGLIPLHDPKLVTSNKKVFLIGDAAAQIKNTTGGGLIPGLMAAEELQKAIDKKKNYEQLWRKRIGKSLWTHYTVRNLFNKFKKEDWNKIVNVFNKESMKDILAKESRDKPIQLITKAVLKNPSLLMFLKKFF